MDTIYISYEEAKKYYESRKGILKRRRKGGNIYETVKTSFRLFKQHPDLSYFSRLIFNVSGYCIGDKATGFLLRKWKTEEFRLGDVFTPQNNQILYHWAPADSIDRIKKHGLLHGEKFKYVYLTDNNDYFSQSDYFCLKAYELGKNENFVLLKINGKKLSENYKIFYVFSEHKFAVEKVPAECILNLSL